MDRLRRVQYCIAAVACLLAAAGLPLRARTPAPIRVGTDPADTYTEVYYARDLGLFKKAGLNVEIVDLANGAAIASAVAGGAVEFGISTPVQLAQAVSRGVPFSIVAAGAMYSTKAPTTVLCVAKNSPIRGAREMEGKTVEISSLKTSSELGVVAWVAANGGDVAKVHIIEMPFAAMGAALERGAIDAALISEPSLTVALNGGARVLAKAFDAIAPEFLLSAWFTTTPYAKQNPTPVKRFDAVIYEAGRWANTHQTESAVILAKYSKLDLDMLRTMKRATFPDALRLRDLQSQLDSATKYEVPEHSVNAADLIARE